MKQSKSIIYGVNYNPTWIGWKPGEAGQLSDADFFNDAFQAMWDKGETNAPASYTYRNDLQTISDANLKLIRLFNWGPTRGWDGTKGDGHIGALNRAKELGLKVIVPVSNYFLSNDKYAWNGSDPDSNFSFDSAPEAIQTDLKNFISSVIYNTTIHPAVHSFSVGNEIDLNNMIGQGSSGYVSPASRLNRAIWWMINLQKRCDTISKGLSFTCPFSDADQGRMESSPLSYWFQAVINGVSNDTNLPNGTVAKPNQTTFDCSVKGLSKVSNSKYKSWYYNSVNIYTTGSKLTSTVGQYDNWMINTSNTKNWPGQQFDVPLMFTEVGYNRGNEVVSTKAQEEQYKMAVNYIIKAIQNYVNTNTGSLLEGICIYEFNDETYLNANWGMKMVKSPSKPSGQILFKAKTGVTKVSFGEFPNIEYPVQKLYPVQSGDGTTLLDGIKKAIHRS